MHFVSAGSESFQMAPVSGTAPCHQTASAGNSRRPPSVPAGLATSQLCVDRALAGEDVIPLLCVNVERAFSAFCMVAQCQRAPLKAAGPSVHSADGALGEFCLTRVVVEAERFWPCFARKKNKIKNCQTVRGVAGSGIAICIPRPGRGLSAAIY